MGVNTYPLAAIDEKIKKKQNERSLQKSGYDGIIEFDSIEEEFSSTDGKLKTGTEEPQKRFKCSFAE